MSTMALTEMSINQSICAFHNLLLGRAKEIKLSACDRNLGQHCTVKYTSCNAFSEARHLPELQCVFCCELPATGWWQFVKLSHVEEAVKGLSN